MNINFIVYWLFMAVFIYFIVWFYAVIMEVKVNIRIIYGIYFVMNFINTELVGNALKLYVVKGILYLIYEFCIVEFCYKAKFSKKIVCYLQVHIITVFIEISNACFVIITNIGMDKITNYGPVKSILLIGDLIIEIFIFFIIISLQKKIVFSLDAGKMKTIIICYGVQCFMLFYFITTYKMLDLRAVNMYTFLIIPADIYLIIYLRTMEVKQLTEEKVKYIEKQNEIIIKYLICRLY